IVFSAVRMNTLSTGPGLTLLTRMRRAATSLATQRISPISACLAASYDQLHGTLWTPTMLAVMMMLPPSFICGIVYLQDRKQPRTWVAMILSNKSSGYSVIGINGPSLPALEN